MNLRDSLESLAIALLGAASLLLAPIAHAQTPANADSVYDGFLRAYLVASGGKTYVTNSLTDRGEAFQWQQAYLITGVEDAYDRDKSPARQTLVSSLLDEFIAKNFTNKSSTDLAWDTWNDDSAWATIALARGYQITGNPIYLKDAKAVWDMAYNRGWDSALGGGIWENQKKGAKCALSNTSFVPAAIILYQATGDASYLTKAEALYAWTRTKLMDSTGQVNECINTDGSESRDSNVYNGGLQLNAAAILYRITGKQQYHDDAVLVATYQTKRWPIMAADYKNNGPFGCDQFFRGLSNFARWNGLWSQYAPWLKTTTDAAWNSRRTDYNISQNDFKTQTPSSGDLLAMESESSMILQQVIAIEAIANPPVFSGPQQLQNDSSKLTVAVSGASSASGAAIVQEAAAGGNDALWTITATGGGYYQITNVGSGLALAVKDASSLAGANMVQLPVHDMRPGDDQWMPILNADGTYTFFNLNSQQVLEIPKASPAAGTQLAQAFANGTDAQKFRLSTGAAGSVGASGTAQPDAGTPMNTAGAGSAGVSAGTNAGGAAGAGTAASGATADGGAALGSAGASATTSNAAPARSDCSCRAVGGQRNSAPWALFVTLSIMVARRRRSRLAA